jgi:xylulokinase
MNAYLAVDIGTSNSKGTLIDESGGIIAEIRRGRSNAMPLAGRHENDPETDWWVEFCAIAKQLVNTGAKYDVKAVCVSGMWFNCAAADIDGIPIYPAILYDDSRSADLASALRDEIGPEVYGYELIPRLLWLRRHQPAVMARTRKVFTTHTYIVFRLTGQYCIDSRTACAMGSVLNPADFSWNVDLLERHGFSERLMPRVFTPGSIVGTIHRDAADSCGIHEGVPVVAGTGDSYISILASGAHKPGDIFVYVGTSGNVIALTRPIEYLFDCRGYHDADDGTKWLLSLPRSGQRLASLVSIVLNRPTGALTDQDYAALDNRALTLPPDNEGVSYFFSVGTQGGPVLGSEIPGALTGVGCLMRREHVYRAVMVALAFQVRLALDKSASSARTGNKVFVLGGSAKSRVFKRSLANVLDASVLHSPVSDGALGGALLAAHAVGAIRLSERLQSLVKNCEETEPEAEKVPLFSTRYEQYARECAFLQN